MRRARGTNVKVSTDATGSMISVDWVCPYCNSDNIEMFFSSTIVDVDAGFEYDRECDDCGETVTVECPDVEGSLFD